MRVIAIAIDSPDQLSRMRSSASADFDFLSDPEGVLLDLLGIRHEDGMPDVDIAQSASFLVDGAGRLVWEKVAENYRVRPRPAEILAAADRLPGA